MDDFKGDLRNTRESIIKVKIRDRRGQPLHKAEFSLSDRSSIIRELKLLQDKFGVDCFEIKGKYKNKVIEVQQREIEEEIERLDGWREKTKFLREPDKEFQEKVRKLL